MAIFAYYQYIEGGWVGGSEKVQKPAYVIFEWSLTYGSFWLSYNSMPYVKCQHGAKKT